jgi:hypothetical protein
VGSTPTRFRQPLQVVTRVEKSTCRVDLSPLLKCAYSVPRFEMPLRFQQPFPNVLLGHNIVTVKHTVRLVTADLLRHLPRDPGSRQVANGRVPKVMKSVAISFGRI